MKMRKVFRTGHAVVVAIPSEYRAALRILPGTPICMTLKDRAIVITRAVITPENTMSPDSIATPSASSRKE